MDEPVDVPAKKRRGKGKALSKLCTKQVVVPLQPAEGSSNPVILSPDLSTFSDFEINVCKWHDCGFSAISVKKDSLFASQSDHVELRLLQEWHNEIRAV